MNTLNGQHDADCRGHQNHDRHGLHASSQNLLNNMAKPHRLANHRPAHQQDEGLQNQHGRIADKGDRNHRLLSDT